MFYWFRFLGLNTVTAYQRAKVYGLKIMNRSLNRNPGSTSLESREIDASFVGKNSGDFSRASTAGPSGVSAFIRADPSAAANNNFPRHYRREAPSITVKAQSHL